MPSIQVIRQREREAQERLQASVKRAGEILGIENMRSKVEPQHPARIRRDPVLVNLNDREALADAFEEIVTKLESYEISGDAPATSLEEIDGIGPDLARELRAVGIESVEDLRGANDNDLLALDGIGKAKLKKIREQVG